MNPVEIIFLTVSILTFASGLVVVTINPWRSINRSYLITATLSSLWLISIFMAIHHGFKSSHSVAVFWIRTSNAFSAFLPWSYGLVKFAITDQGSFVQVFRRSLPWLLGGCLLLALVYSDSFVRSSSTPELQKRGIAYSIYLTSLAILCILTLADAGRKLHVCTGVRLLEIKFFVFNICLCTLIVLASFVASNLFGILALRYIGPYVLFMSCSLTIWAICYHRVFDARQVFVALGRHLSSLTVLVGCVLTANQYFSAFLGGPVALSLSASCGALLATYWDHQVIRWLKLDAKQILAGPRAQIIEWAREEADANKLVLRFESFLRDWCQAESVTFHTAESREPPLLILKTTDYPSTFPLLRQTGYTTNETLARRRPDKEINSSKSILAERNLAALIAAPRGSRSPSCVVAFGHKNSLRPYTYPDVQLLIELVELMDNILTQARFATHTAQIDRLETAGMMSRGLAHDLNNLTTPVSTFLLHMETRVASGTPEAAVLADAKHSIKVMQDYIRESLFFSRQCVLDLQNTCPAELLNSTAQLTHSRAHARNVKVVIDEIVDTTFVADRALMLRLLQNLVLNGIDATPNGRRVVLSTSLTDNGQLTFSVTDEGTGVPPELIDRIFEPYFTTKDTGDHVRGLGLGLATSQKISSLHGGALSVSKTVSGGAVFTLTLPRTTQK